MTKWKMYIYVWIKLGISLISFFFKRKNVKKLFCFLRIQVLSLYVLTIEGNGGARGASHIIILFNPLRPKSDLNEI